MPIIAAVVRPTVLNTTYYFLFLIFSVFCLMMSGNDEWPFVRVAFCPGAVPSRGIMGYHADLPSNCQLRDYNLQTDADHTRRIAGCSAIASRHCRLRKSFTFLP